jgi:phosphoenolpyruvate synthase/pyruvate phosphate dikinase
MMQTRRLLKAPIGNIEYGWFFNDGHASLVSKEDAHEIWQRYVDFKVSSSAVIGIVAANGGKHFVNGEVAVVASPTDAVEDGRIVVVPSTSPSYVPLMRKAKALVTDHGGMMSHAAIVAREFNLPCIVGTKQATKVLKDGDKVVLDLVKGEVIK